ncbi:hypothetical protein KKE06_01400 [Candidatus Micrarchaeota archaeon]|nr:hypothetical protein [Candidatus Micrarchaeota archaeon]MBU1930413.1 hypothetical protein [Candidatus Micrarchaeota archaeon]
MAFSRKFWPILLFFIIPFVLAGGVGEACDYSVNGDSECDTANNIYCIDRVCTEYTRTTEGYCTDSDGENEFLGGTVDFLYRTVSGWFVEGRNFDGCMLDGSPVSECGVVRGCTVDEWVCVPAGNLPYSSVGYECANGCDLDKCLDVTEPDSYPETTGTITESVYTGSIIGNAADAESGLQKVEITIQRDSDSYYWNGSNWATGMNWLLTSGLENWSYSMAFSNFLVGDYLLQSRAMDNQDVEETSFGTSSFTIVLSEGDDDDDGGTGTCNFAVNQDTECNSGYYCVTGICTQLIEEPITDCRDSDGTSTTEKGSLLYYYRTSNGSVMDGEVSDACNGSKVIEYSCLDPVPETGQNYESQETACTYGCVGGVCATGAIEIELPDSITDQELLLYIDQWSKEELGSTEELNDLAILQLIEIWKQS